MDKSELYSNINISRTYTKSDFKSFDLDFDVVNNRVIVESVDGTTRDIGQFTSRLGNQINDSTIVPDTGEIVVEFNNGIPNITSIPIKRDFDVRFSSVGEGLYDGSFTISPSNEWNSASSKDIERLVYDTSVLRYIVPIRTFRSDITDTNNVYMSSANLYTHDSLVFFGDQHYDDMSITVSSILDSNPNSLIDRDKTTNFVFNPIDVLEHNNYIIYEFSSEFYISGIAYKNNDVNNATDSFFIYISDNGVDWNEYLNVTSEDFSSGLMEQVIKLGNNVLTRYIKFIAKSIIGNGGVGNLDIVSNILRPQISIYLNHKPLDFDSNFYDFVNIGQSFQVGIKQENELLGSLNPYVGGLFKLENYSKFEYRAPSNLFLPTTTGSIIRFNYSAINNLNISRLDNVFVIPPGIYKFKVSLSGYRCLYHYIFITDEDLNILCKGTLAYGANISANSNVTSVIDQVIIIEKETRIRVNHSTQLGLYNVSGFSSSQDNPHNTFSSLEMWKLMDIDQLDSDALDPYWDNVTILLNGEGGWTDHSKFKLPVINYAHDDDGVEVEEYPLGKAYKFNGDSKYIVTLDAPKNNESISYLYPNCENITIEFFIKPDKSSEKIQYIIGSIGFDSSVNLDSGFDGVGIYIEDQTSLVFHINEHTTKVPIEIGSLKYIIICISNNTLRIFIDGIIEKTETITSENLEAQVTRIIMGSSIILNNSVIHPYTGLIGNLRITSGVDRYESTLNNIPVPTQSFNKYFDNN